jgi:hypothetical protein
VQATLRLLDDRLGVSALADDRDHVANAEDRLLDAGREIVGRPEEAIRPSLRALVAELDLMLRLVMSEPLLL